MSQKGSSVITEEIINNTNPERIVRENEFELLTISQAKAFLGVGTNTIYKLVKTGEIPHVEGLRGIKIRKGALYDFIMAHEKKGR